MSRLEPLSELPAIFFGHCSPMNIIEDNKYTQSWTTISKSFAKPKAIISISAHWETKGTKVTSNEIQKTIHDFYGFPKELYEIDYSSKGNLDLATKINKLIPKIDLDDSWGLDHGTWSILKHIYPNKDIPVIQISIDRNKTPQEHYELAKKLQIFRDEGVLIIGSGNIVHNLRMIKWNEDSIPYPWAVDFNSEIKSAILNNDIKKIFDYRKIKGSREAVPTHEHFTPLIYILGLHNEAEKASFFAEGFEMGSLSMDSFIIR
jgi:4,5-DOPA dioxygenase extradiol